MGILFFFICVAVLVPFLATHPPDTGEVSKRLQAPSKEHWLGTDRVGKRGHGQAVVRPGPARRAERVRRATRRSQSKYWPRTRNSMF